MISSHTAQGCGDGFRGIIQAGIMTLLRETLKNPFLSQKISLALEMPQQGAFKA